MNQFFNRVSINIRRQSTKTVDYLISLNKRNNDISGHPKNLP